MRSQDRPLHYSASRGKKLLLRAYIGTHQRSFQRHHPRPPTAFSSSRLEVRDPHPKLQSLLSQERVKIQTSNLARTITGSIRTKAHERFWRKGSVGVSRSGRDCPIFSGTPYYLRNGKIYGFQIWAVHSEGPSEQKPIKNFGETGVWAYPGPPGTFFGYPLLSHERDKLRISHFKAKLSVSAERLLSRIIDVLLKTFSAVRPGFRLSVILFVIFLFGFAR